MKARAKLQTTTKNLLAEVARLSKTQATLESRRKYRCVWLRNQYITKRVRGDFARRQKKLSRLANYDRKKYDGSIEVFPVSASAFTDLLKRNKKPMNGFPSRLYTGIPRFRQWVDEAVFPYRENHLDSILGALQRLHDGIRRWSDDDTRGAVVLSRQQIESLLEDSHDKYREVSPIPGKRC